MKKFLLLLMCFVWSSAMFAEKDPENYKVVVCLKDGTQFEGYMASPLANYLSPRVSEVSISKEFGGEKQKYTSDEVVSIEFVQNDKNDKPVIYHSVMAQSKMPNLLSKNPKPYKQRIFLRLVYDGKNIKGYAMPLFDRTFGQTIDVLHYTWRYFYKTVDDDVAKGYWDDTDGTIPNAKKVMKFYFREFPELQKMVDDESLTQKAFRDNPAMVLPIMDETYKKK